MLAPIRLLALCLVPLISVVLMSCGEGPPLYAEGPLDKDIDVTKAKSWLVQKVCADERGAQPIDPFNAADPYGSGGCPAGMTQRELLPSDPLPYDRFSDLTSHAEPFAAAVSAPVWDTDGNEFVMMQRSFTPGRMSAFSTNLSHFDTYRIGGDWISEYGTHDGASFNLTFFGLSGGAVTPYNGWTDFPGTRFLNTVASHVVDPVLGSSWELCGVPPPGTTPDAKALNLSSLQYQLLTHFPFGSVGGIAKPMNTLIASHQSAPSVFPANADADAGHVEIWYFTVPYGPTRWEVWSAAECLKPHQGANPPPCPTSLPAGSDAWAKSGACSCLPKDDRRGNCADGPTAQQMTYMGSDYLYTRIMCRDWSNVFPVAAGSAVAAPSWPSPQANLLRNYHFSTPASGPAGARTSDWTIGDALEVASVQSTALYDTTVAGRGPPGGCPANTPAGVRYLTLACTRTDAPCSSLSQDMPVSSHPVVMKSGTYAFGVTARTERASGSAIGEEVPAGPLGTLRLTLEQVDESGQVIGGAMRASTTQTITPAVVENVKSAVPATQANLIQSVVLSSAWIGTTAPIEYDVKTVSLRLSITPQTPGQIFDLVDASVSRIGPP